MARHLNEGRLLRGKRLREALIAVIVFSIAACSKSDGTDVDTTVPTQTGDVWGIDPGTDSMALPAAVLAYVNGLQVVVVDGKKIYASMTALQTESSADGGQSVELAGNLEAMFIPIDDKNMELRFSSGESISLHKKEVDQ